MATLPGAVSVCDSAWNIFERYSRGEDTPEDILNSAINHIEGCEQCMERREVSMADALDDLIAPTKQQQPTSSNSSDDLLLMIIRAIGVPKENISEDMPLYPFQITRLLSKLFRISGCRVNCFPDRATFGNLMAEWERQVILRREEARRIGY